MPSATDSHEARRRFLTFVVIGGGPTGVEMAGAIAELAHVALRHDFRTIDPREARVILVEAGPRRAGGLPAGAERGGAFARWSGCMSRSDWACRSRVATQSGVTIGEEHLPPRPSSGPPASRPRRPRIGWAVERDRIGRVAGRSGSHRAGSSRDFRHRRHGKRSPARTASRCRAWRRSPSSRAPTSRACCGRGSPASRRRRRSAIATTARWRPSAGGPPSRISAGCDSTERSPG